MNAKDAEETRRIGQRLRVIRHHRGMGLDLTAGLAGISKPYLSQLERGLRGFNRRGLLEDLAQALGCSVADLTGQPYHLPDRQNVALAAAVEAFSTVLHDTTLDDAPDVPVAPLPELANATTIAHTHIDEARYGFAGQGLDDLLVGLHVWVVTSNSGEERVGALVKLAEACKVAYVLAKRSGQIELAGIAAQRGLSAARRAERPDLVGMLEMSRTSTLIGLGARRRAAVVCGETLQEILALPGPTADDTRVAEASGMLHLTTALIAGRDGRSGDVATHFAEARSLATYTGERNHMYYHFGPTNVAAWELGLAIEMGTGPDAAQRFSTAAIDLSVFGSKGRTAYVHFDLARAWAQAEGSHDDEAIRALDAADRLAPLRIRNDPIARDLVLTLDRRAPRRVWELESLRNRFGLGKR